MINYLKYESRVYVKVRSSQSCTYVKCTLNRASGCPRNAHIDHVANKLRLTREHHHDEDVPKSPYGIS